MAMQGLGERMRGRAREIGLTDSEVARRLGLTQQRYASYVADRTEPDMATFVRICSVLGVSPNTLLLQAEEESADDRVLARIMTALRALDHEHRSVAAVVVDGLLSRSKRPQGGKAGDGGRIRSESDHQGIRQRTGGGEAG